MQARKRSLILGAMNGRHGDLSTCKFISDLLENSGGIWLEAHREVQQDVPGAVVKRIDILYINRTLADLKLYFYLHVRKEIGANDPLMPEQRNKSIYKL